MNVIRYLIFIIIVTIIIPDFPRLSFIDDFVIIVVITVIINQFCFPDASCKAEQIIKCILFPVFLIIYALIFNGFVFIFTSIVLNNFVAIFDSIILNGFVFILTSVALNVFAAIFDDLILIVVLNDNFFRFLIAHIIRRQIFSHEFSKEIRIFLAETICQNTHIICFLCFFICFILSFCIIHTHSICLCCCIFSCICLFRGFSRRYLFFRHRFRMPFSIHRFRHFQAMIPF